MQTFDWYKLCSSSRRLVPLFVHTPYWGFSRKTKRSQPDPRICSTCRKQFTILSSVMTYHWVGSDINLIGVTSGGGTSYPSGPPEFTLVVRWVCVTRALILCVCFVDRFLSFCSLFWSFCCLFFDLQIMIAPLVSSNSSYIDQVQCILQTIITQNNIMLSVLMRSMDYDYPTCIFKIFIASSYICLVLTI